MFVTVNNSRVHYELSGPPGKPLVVLSHSLASSLKMWDPQMAALTAHFRVLRYDTRGHGKSEVTPPPYSFDLLADDAIGLLDALHMDEVHWVGLSLGGMIAQNLALRHPERLKSLCLCDTTSRMPQEMQPIWEERIAAVDREGMSSQLEPTMVRWFSPAFLSQAPPVLDLIKTELLDTPALGYLGCASAVRRVDYLDRLGEIRKPTLIMVGADDPATPVSASQALHERIAGSKLVIIPEARHLSNVEAVEEFNAHLLGFLRSL